MYALPVRARACLLLLLAAPAFGCIEDRLTVDITTTVYTDGSCSRRVEYRLERVDTDKGDARRPIPARDDALRRFHRFPTGEAWAVRDDPQPDLHTVLMDATLPSPNDIDWDYWRQLTKRSPPARNYISFAMDKAEGGSGTVYDFSETFLDTASPMAGARLMAQAFAKRDDEFAERISAALGARAPRRSDAKRVYRERFVSPFVAEVQRLADRPVFGPRERKDLEKVFDRIEEFEKGLLEGLQALSPSLEPAEIEEAAGPAINAVAEIVEKEMDSSGLPLPIILSENVRSIRFRVTLVMPGQIVRANTCVQGETATWEFEQDDLYGRGFEMWARAVLR